MDNSKSAAKRGVWRNDLLSIEILLTIFMSLNVADLAVASLVCKMWNKACHEPSLWRKIDLSKLNSSYFLNIPNNQPGAYKRTSGKITQFLKYVLSLSNGNTDCLVFNYNVYLTDEQFIIAAERTPNLKQLVLPRTGDFSREAVHMAMKSWVGLEYITITSDIFPAIREFCKNIIGIKFGCGLEEKHVEALIESTPNLKMFSIRSTVVSMKALISLLTSLENLEAVNIVHSVIMDMSSPDEFNFFNIHDLENDLPPSIMEKLIYCEGGSCLKCQYERNNAPGFFQVSAIEDRSVEDIWREDEITSLAH